MPKKVGAGRNLQEYSEKNGEYLEDDFSGGTQATVGVQDTGTATSDG